MMFAMRSRWRWFWKLTLGLAVSAGVGWNCMHWSGRIPFDGAPDEADHYALQKFVADQGRLPRYGEGEFAVHVMGRGHNRLPPDTSPDRLQWLLSSNMSYELRLPYVFSPQMPYWLGGMYARLLGGISVPKARSFSALCIALAVLCTYGAGMLLWKKPLPAAAAALCFGLWPQVSFIGAYVNDDTYAVCAVAFLLLALTWVRLDCLAWKRVIVMGVAVGAAAAAKFYVYAVFPLLLLWWGTLWRKHGRAFLPRLAVALGCAALVASPWFIRNAILYEGDFLARTTAERHVAQYVDNLPPLVRAKTQLLFDQQEQGFGLAKLVERGYFRLSFESFWGRFGWMNLRLQPTDYTWALAAVLGALGFSFLGLPFLRGASARLTVVPHLFALPYFVLLLGMSLYNSLYVDYQPQGKYMLSAVPALCLQCFDVPARGRRILQVAGFGLLAFFLVQNIAAWRRLG